MALTMPLLLLVAALSSANTGVEYDYHEEDQPTHLSLSRLRILFVKPSQAGSTHQAGQTTFQDLASDQGFPCFWSRSGLPFGKGRKSLGQTGHRECGGKLILAMPILFPATEDISFQHKTFDEQSHVQGYIHICNFVNFVIVKI